MNRLSFLAIFGVCISTAFPALFCPAPVRAAEPEFQVLFNGKNLDGWKGTDSLWSVRDGMIVGETKKDAPIEASTFLIWQGDETGSEAADFEFRCLVRFQGNNSGVQYRSKLVDESALALAGYQADLHPKSSYMGMMYGEKTGRGIIAEGGNRIHIDADGKSKVVNKLVPFDGTAEAQWNELRIVAVGNRMIHQVNGITTVDVTDEHSEASIRGSLGLQLHRGEPMKVEFRNVLFRRLTGDEAGKVLSQAIASTKTNRATESDVAKKEVKPKSASPVSKKWLLESPTPNWIWAKKADSGQRVWFRHSFELPANIASAHLYASGDNEVNISINGKPSGASKDWGTPVDRKIGKKLLREGKNLIAVAAGNEGGIAAMVVKLEIELKDGSIQTIVTNSDWKLSETEYPKWQSDSFDDSKWKSATAIGDLGRQPWGLPMLNKDAGRPGVINEAVNARNIFVPPGFVVDRIHVVTKEQGSWVSLTTDPQGRIYACDQGGAGLYRITIREKDSPLIEKVSVGALKNVSAAQGMEWAFDSLWFHRNGGNLLRLTDSDGDDILDAVQTIPSTTGGGEHGNHAVLTTEDGTGLYLDGGNAAPLGEHIRSRVPTWSEGLLLPRMWDANGHARNRMAPGGWITRLDPKTNEQTLRTIGFRNQYDIALSRKGDLFAYDADMEWDFGLPWYRPTRICMAVSGADYGWRSGAAKWPTYYEDSLPPVVEIGPGSPTGLVSGAGSSFPTKYQDALFALDWTYGTMYAIHMTPDGAGYRGEAEPFLYSTPLPLTDSVIGNDGAMYFSVGGRGSQSALFRVRYVGNQSRQQPSEVDAGFAAAREKRRMLEEFHGVENANAIDAAWPLLSSDDRFLRHAARVAIESQPVEQWATRVFAESNAQARITASVALARMGDESHQEPLLQGLLALEIQSLSQTQLLGMLRAYSLAFIELGRPNDELSANAIRQLNPMLPHKSDNVNNELVRVLTYLQDENLSAKVIAMIENRSPTELPPWSKLAKRSARYGGTIEQMLKNHPPTRELAYAYMTRNLRAGWTLQQRRTYFEFLNDAAKASGGASYAGYLTRIRDEALASCTARERVALEDVTGEDFNPKPDFPIVEPVGPGRKWTVDEVLKSNRGKKDFERGRSLFFSAKCASCHRLRGLGGDIGPDLTSVRNKFDMNYLVEATVHPSKHISDQYGSSIVETVDGKVLTGLVIKNENGDLTVYPIDENAKAIEVKAEDVELIEASEISQMPEGLLNRLNKDEVRDLLNYVMSGGDPNDKMYQKR